MATFLPVPCRFASELNVKQQRLICTVTPTRELDPRALYSLSVHDFGMLTEQQQRFRETWFAVEQWDEKTVTLPPPLMRIVREYAAPLAEQMTHVRCKRTDY